MAGSTASQVFGGSPGSKDYMQTYLEKRKELFSNYQGSVIGDYQFDRQLMNSYVGKNQEEGNALSYKRARLHEDKLLMDFKTYNSSNSRLRISDPNFKGLFWTNNPKEEKEPAPHFCCKNPESFYNFAKCEEDPSGDCSGLNVNSAKEKQKD